MPRFIRKGNSLRKKTLNRSFTRSSERIISPRQSLKQDTSLLSQNKIDEPEIASINRLIDQATDRLSQHNSTTFDSPVPSFTPTPDEYNGINNHGEAYKILNHEITNEQKRAKELEDRLRIIQMDFESEKAELSNTILELKRELHRTKPLHDNALFSLTKDLRDSVSAMQQLMADSNLDYAAVNSLQPERQLSFSPNEVRPLTNPVKVELTEEQDNPAPRRVNRQPTVMAETLRNAQEPSKTVNKSRKLFTASIAGIAVLGLISAVLAYSLIKKPKVNQKLVEEYLNKDTQGQVAGTATQNTTALAAAQQAALPANEASSKNNPNLDADVPFEQTIWETLKEPNFGIQLQYPANTTKLLKTDSNITFLRKDGYIFKVQRIETALSPEEYWKQVKATSLNYNDTKTQFLNREALFLELNDVTDYPGNRFLVKEGNFIFDFWYATENEMFTNDDIRRAKYMLDTVNLGAS